MVNDMTEPIVETITSKDGKRRGVIYYDTHNDETPRDWDNFGVMLCWHNRYNLGDKQIREMDYDSEEYDSIEDYLKKEYNAIVSLPLYLYDHSGITMNTGGFSCGWDSGCVGIIYATKDKVIEEFGDTDPETLKKVREILVGEVSTYDDYLTGQVFGFEIFEQVHRVEKCPKCGEIIHEWVEEEVTDSCWGYYGLDDLRKEVEQMVN